MYTVLAAGIAELDDVPGYRERTSNCNEAGRSRLMVAGTNYFPLTVTSVRRSVKQAKRLLYGTRLAWLITSFYLSLAFFFHSGTQR